MAPQNLGKIKTRIRALAERTVANGCTPAEAESAARMVSDLMRRHGLTAADVARDEPTSSSSSGYSSSWTSAPRSGRGFDSGSGSQTGGFGQAHASTGDEADDEPWTPPPPQPRGFPWKFAGILAVIMLLAGGGTIAGLMALSRVVNNPAVARHKPQLPTFPTDIGPAGIPQGPISSPAATIQTAPTGEECQGVILISGGHRKDCVEIDKAAGGNPR